MDNSAVQEIKDRLNIVELIESYIQVKKAGTTYKAVCPFHNEKSASLMVSPQKQIWHCFGCGEGGDVFSFVMRYENVEFKEALGVLAAKAGVVLPEYGLKDLDNKDKKKLIIRINTFAATFYQQLLQSTEGSPARAYLAQRGLTESTLQRWKLGFAPNEYHILEQALAKKQVSKDDLVIAGVSVKNEQGQYYDRFRNRITFPITDYVGAIVGFSARTLEQNQNTAKYINSPETTVYNKSKVLFGLYFAKEAIRKQDEVVVVEGQMDCIQAHQAGFANTVATSGTALTREHLYMLARLTKQVKFCFDADTAGKAATRKAGELALSMGFRVKVIVLSLGKDPDELIRSNAQLWQHAVNEALWFIDYYREQAAVNFPYNSVEQKKYISESVIPLLQFVGDPIEQDHYIQEIAEQFSIQEYSLRTVVQKAGSSTTTVLDAVYNRPSLSGGQTETSEKEILGGLLLYPEYRVWLAPQYKREDFSIPEVVALVEPLLSGGSLLPPQVDSTLAKEAEFMVESESIMLEGNETALLRQLQKSFNVLKVVSIRRQQNTLTTEIKKAEQVHNSQLVLALNKQFAELSALRVEYESKL